MLQVRFHPGDPSRDPAGSDSLRPRWRSEQASAPKSAANPDAGGRLNLLISCASWRGDSWADRIPTLLEPFGVYSLRARSACEAEQTIRRAPVHIAVVDLGLPLDSSPAASDPSSPTYHSHEGGPRILELLRRLDAPPPTVVIKGPRSQRDESRHLSAALQCGAFAVVDRSSATLEQMLDVLRRCLTRFYQDRWPGR
ncbi:MAG: hypothetical protein KF745_05785 [Phycisphaeraceae bacterium]|nr:hypothetical protein [Phycisphaeraceae bacterium]